MSQTTHLPNDHELTPSVLVSAMHGILDGNHLTMDWVRTVYVARDVDQRYSVDGKSTWFGNEAFFENPDYAFTVEHNGRDSHQERTVVTHNKITTGLDVMKIKNPEHYELFMTQSPQADSETYDLWFQYVVLGDCVFS